MSVDWPGEAEAGRLSRRIAKGKRGRTAAWTALGFGIAEISPRRKSGGGQGAVVVLLCSHIPGGAGERRRYGQVVGVLRERLLATGSAEKGREQVGGGELVGNLAFPNHEYRPSERAQHGRGLEVPLPVASKFGIQSSMASRSSFARRVRSRA